MTSSLRYRAKQRPLQQWQQWLPIGSILLLAVVLYLFRLDYRGLWIDEFLSIEDAQNTTFNRGRLLYYVLLGGWMQISQSDVWLRSLSILFALLSIFLVYRLGQLLISKSVGLMAALMLTLSPLFINHAQEVRYYTMSVALGLLGTLCLSYGLQFPEKLSWRWGWGGARILAIYTTPLNGALFLPDVLLIVLKFWRQRSHLKRFSLVWLGAIAAMVPVAISVKAASSAHRLILPVPGVRNVLRELHQTVEGLNVFLVQPKPRE
jgi:4-amino-4-deoxy-L-arabinose transferase-like glycosyltransferase